jgi:hypothetical protein
MKDIVITSINHYHHDDFDELNLRFDDHPAQSTVAQVADDKHNVFLQVNPETQEIVGATIIYADDWFAEIADAFRRGDLNHPDVAFFMREKIKAWVSARDMRKEAEQPAIV